MQNSANFWQARSLAVSKRNFARKYAVDSIFQALQDLHTSAPLQSQNFSKNRFEKAAIFVKIQQQMLQNLQNTKFQKFQLDNLVDFDKCCKTRIYLQRSAPIQPKTSENCQKLATTLLSRQKAQDAAGRIDFLKVDVEGAEWAVIEG